MKPALDMMLGHLKGAATVSDANEKNNGARGAESNEDMVKVNDNEERREFAEEFNGWIVELEQQIESTRRSELLTQEDYAIQINAQG